MNVCITRRRSVTPELLASTPTAPAPSLTHSQATRVRALQRAYRNAEAANPRDDAPKAGAIRNLGLLGQEKDTKEVLSK